MTPHKLFRQSGFAAVDASPQEAGRDVIAPRQLANPGVVPGCRQQFLRGHPHRQFADVKLQFETVAGFGSSHVAGVHPLPKTSVRADFRPVARIPVDKPQVYGRFTGAPGADLKCVPWTVVDGRLVFRTYGQRKRALRRDLAVVKFSRFELRVDPEIAAVEKPIDPVDRGCAGGDG